MSCQACGFDPSAVVTASWSFFVELDAKSLNGHVVNAGGSRWGYAKERGKWTLAIKAATGQLISGLRLASVFRRVTITRCYFGRQQLREYDNLVGGYKLVVDSLVQCGILVDDSAKHAQIIYKQERSQPTGLRFLVEELADA